MTSPKAIGIKSKPIPKRNKPNYVVDATRRWMQFMADRPALRDEEIETTPEMIEAGAEVLLRYDPSEDSLYGTVRALLRAAFEARPRPRRGNGLL